MDISEVSTLEGLETLRTEWSGLWDRCPAATPFQSPEWLLPWWRHLGHGSLWVFAIRHQGRLAGIAPFFLHRAQDSGIRRLLFIGTGITDYLDVLIEPEIEREGADMILQYIEAQRSLWDAADLQELRPNSPLLAAPSLTGLNALIAMMKPCPVLTLPSAVDAYYGGLSSANRRRFRRARKAFEQSGLGCFEVAEYNALDEFLNGLVALHRARWELRNLPGVLSGTDLQGFYRETAAGFYRRGWLRLCRVRYRKKTAAVLYAFVSRKRFYCYLGGFDPVLKRLSPGIAIITCAIESAIRSGIEEFDFLRGEEHYKYEWGARNRINYRLSIRSGTNACL